MTTNIARAPARRVQVLAQPLELLPGDAALEADLVRVEHHEVAVAEVERAVQVVSPLAQDARRPRCSTASRGCPERCRRGRAATRPAPRNRPARGASPRACSGSRRSHPPGTGRTPGATAAARGRCRWSTRGKGIPATVGRPSPATANVKGRSSSGVVQPSGRSAVAEAARAPPPRAPGGSLSSSGRSRSYGRKPAARITCRAPSDSRPAYAASATASACARRPAPDTSRLSSTARTVGTGGPCVGGGMAASDI